MIFYTGDYVSVQDEWNKAHGTSNSASATAVNTDNPTLGDYVFGNVDYNRQLELLGLQNQFTADQNAKMMAFNADEARKAREWQEMMSNTAYSRAMADAKKAGINPALIFSQGGASTPTGSSAYANAQGATSPGSRGNQGALASVIGSIFGSANTAMKIFAMLSK